MQLASIAKAARKRPDPEAIANYIHPGKYARHQPDLQRRETFLETVGRVEDMHALRYPQLEEEIRWAFDRVRAKKVLPSMRSMQFGGRAIETNHARIYNCVFSLADRIRFFQESFFLLLSGVGVGFSVQKHHVARLPALSKVITKNVVHHTVKDTIEGWADAVGVLFDGYLNGYYAEFAYHDVRDEGTLLKTSGGRAPGHLPLKKALEAIRAVLDGAQGRQLRPWECYRIMCLLADAVLSGGIRRSAMIALFSLDDVEMMECKTGNWREKYPEFENSNNSVVLQRGRVTWTEFRAIFERTRQWGEPGFYFTWDIESGANPCVEIGLNPNLVITTETLAIANQLREMGRSVPQLTIGERHTGWQFCNLSEQNAAKFASREDFLEAAEAAAIIGTLQAGYQDFPYLGWISEVIARREALIGVGMTGIMDSPEIALDPLLQREAAALVVATNQRIAKIIGIAAAARTTCVKPSGTTSLELGCTGSGIHGHHAKRYIRRVNANENERPFQHFRAANPHMCVHRRNRDWVIEFPVEAPEGAVLRLDFTALEFLEKVKSTQQNWVLPGTARPDSSPGVYHNVSNTVTVRDHEWDDVAKYLFENKDYFTGVSFVPDFSDKLYSFAPNEAIATPEDEARWDELISKYVPVDYTTMLEFEDETNLKGEAACGGASGSCERV